MHYPSHNLQVAVPAGFAWIPAGFFCLQLAYQGPDLYLGFSLICLICALVLQFDLYLGFSNMAWIEHDFISKT